MTREVLRVTPATDPMQVALLVDTSQAARDAIQHIRLALPPFVAELTKANAAGKKTKSRSSVSENGRPSSPSIRPMPSSCRKGSIASGR